MNRILATVAAMAIVTIATRAAPFLFFSKRKPPASLDFLQAYLPPALMTILVLSAFRNVSWAASPHGAPALAGAVATAVLHLWRRNVLLSIAGGTAIYMALIRLIA
ncbi:MAG: AzlD domain-containing protein [Spirochaetes bacterium]|nr:AzlD domain-containing protein [Spirochaetota bacterium]MBU1079251.1 AzlD domain-containing protein [Spirochaetota bacterium]